VLVPKRGYVRALTIVLAASMALTACGGDSDDSGQAASSQNQDQVKADAAKTLAGAADRPTSIGITEPIGGEIPSGKTVAFMTCSLPSCTEIATIAEDAAAALGWTVNKINIGVTPETVKAGYAQAVQSKPDAVMGTGFGPELFGPELDALSEMGIPVLLASVAVEDPKVTATFMNAESNEHGGALQAAWTIAKYGTDSHTLVIDVPDLTTVHAWYEGFTAEYKRLCPDCELGEVSLATSDLGTPKVTSQVTTYVQSHPTTNAIQMATSNIALGLPPALEGVGYDGSVGVLNADDAVREYMRDGEVTVSNAIDWPTTVWKMFDTAARTMLGESIDPDLQAPETNWLYESDDIPEGSGYRTPLVIGYEDQFKELWNIS
jgi:ABC-type sugar transport system substrate-binding protein